MTSIEQIKQASKMVIFTDAAIIKKYFASISKEISSTSMAAICDEIVRQYDIKKLNEDQYYGLHTFINAEIVRKFNITL